MNFMEIDGEDFIPLLSVFFYDFLSLFSLFTPSFIICVFWRSSPLFANFHILVFFTALALGGIQNGIFIRHKLFDCDQARAQSVSRGGRGGLRVPERNSGATISNA